MVPPPQQKTQVVQEFGHPVLSCPGSAWGPGASCELRTRVCVCAHSCLRPLTNFGWGCQRPMNPEIPGKGNKTNPLHGDALRDISFGFRIQDRFCFFPVFFLAVRNSELHEAPCPSHGWTYQDILTGLSGFPAKLQLTDGLQQHGYFSRSNNGTLSQRH